MLLLPGGAKAEIRNEFTYLFGTSDGKKVDFVNNTANSLIPKLSIDTHMCSINFGKEIRIEYSQSGLAAPNPAFTSIVI